MPDKKRLLSDEEVDFLARKYLSLKSNPVHLLISKTFQQFIDAYLEEEATIKTFMGVRP